MHGFLSHFIFPPAMNGSSCSTLFFGHSNQCSVVSHWFISHHMMTYDVEHLSFPPRFTEIQLVDNVCKFNINNVMIWYMCILWNDYHNKAAVLCLVAQSCLTLCDPVDCSLPGSSVHGIFQASIKDWVVISFYRGSSQPRDQTHISYVSWVADKFFIHLQSIFFLYVSF